MLGRRAILKAMAASPMTAAMGAKAMGQSLGVATTGGMLRGEEIQAAFDGPMGPSNDMQLIWQASRRHEIERHVAQAMPAHISTKKSWSPAFKAHCTVQEAMIFDAWRMRTERDEEFRGQVLELMGVKT